MRSIAFGGRLSTPSLGITWALVLDTDTLTAVNFQLPLSGSRDDENLLFQIATAMIHFQLPLSGSLMSLPRRSIDSGLCLSTPSLGITEIGKRIPEESGIFGLPFNSLSRDHLRDFFFFLAGSYKIFQLPLSGSLRIFSFRSSWRARGSFQLPLSGSQEKVLESVRKYNVEYFQLPLSGSRDRTSDE